MSGGLIALTTFARDFEYEYQGQTLTYTVIDENAKTCETKAGTLGATTIYPGNSTGAVNLVIPASVKDENNMEYSVVKIGAFGFGVNTFQSVTIPETIKVIDQHAFWHCTDLVSVTIPEGVTEIGYSAFQGCTALTSVTIPEGVTEIGYSAFQGCATLTSVTIPESVTYIGMGAFGSCSALTSITIPEGITLIGANAFWGCTSLISVYYGAKVPRIGYDGTFSDEVYEGATLYVPEEAIGRCKEIDPWRKFKKIEAFNFAGIEDIVADFDAEKPYEVYNLSGVKVADSSFDGLTPGHYIRRQGAKTEKIIVK